jgi:hypothetical protein
MAQEARSGGLEALPLPGAASDNTILGRLRTTNPTILLEDGSNYLAWKTVMEFYLRQETDLWEVTTGTKNPDSDANSEVTKAYNKANAAAKPILINSIHSNIVLDLFFNTIGTQTAATIWKAIHKRYSKDSGILKHQIMLSFMGFKYNSSEPAGKNIARFKQILNRMTDVKINIDNPMKCAKLIDSLPSDWEGLKLSWGSKSETEQLPSLLYELILAESARRNENAGNQTEALFSRMKISKKGFRKNRFYRSTGTNKNSKWNSRQTTNVTTQDTEITCYNCGKKGHTKWNCRAKKNPKRKVNVNNAEALLALYDDQSADKTNAYVVDSGSSDHIVNDKRWFISYEKFAESREVRLGGARSLHAEGSGTIRLYIRNQDRTVKLELKGVIFVNKMRRNLISVSKLADEGYKIICDSDGLTISNNGDTSVTADRINDLFMLNVQERIEEGPQSGECLNLDIASKTPKLSLMLAHKTLAHLGKNKIISTLKREGINYIDDMDACESCIRGKQHRATYKSKPKESLARSKGYLHADLCTPSEPSLGGAKYFLCITDEFSKFRKVFFLKTKDQTADAL